MVLSGGSEFSVETGKELPSNPTPNTYGPNSQKVLNVSISQKELLTNEDPTSSFPVSVKPSKPNFLKLGALGSLDFPSSKLWKIAEKRDEESRSVPSSAGQSFRERINGLFSQNVNWVSLRQMLKEWIKNPFNMAFLLWITCVAVSGAVLFLVMTGMLNSLLPRKSRRDVWFEANNQILNALFTLMCLYQHPKRFHHLVLLCRWNPNDISALRNIYCKNGAYKPHEWIHMLVVILLLHVNCFAQYALCGLNLGFRRSERPAIGVGICLSFAIAAPAIAGIYCIVSPLGKDYEAVVDEESQDHGETSHGKVKTLQKRFSFATKTEQVEDRPKWRGGLLDFWDDLTVAYLSLFCSFCVFGWNMERLGFGNVYVHIATFLLFCTAPFWIFNLAAINIDNETVREAMGLTGIILCVFGLLYGGFWRIQMRKRFKLPPDNSCCGKPAIADCAGWLCCWWCSLAQEVRTADFYEIVEDKFCRKHINENGQPSMLHLSSEDEVQFRSSPVSNATELHELHQESFSGSSKHSKANFSPDGQLSRVHRNLSTIDAANTMRPPFTSLICREMDGNGN